MKRVALVFAAAVVLYLPTVQYGFVQDDRAIIAQNPAAHSPVAAVRAFDDPYWPAASGAGLYRPFTILTYSLDWQLFRGHAGWMHLTNAVLHGAVCVLLLLVLGRWLGGIGAMAAALVFALHPVHVEAVASLVSRAELLAAAGILGAVLAARRRLWVGAIVCAALAMLSKEHGVVAGVVMLVDDWLQEKRLSYPPAFYFALGTLTIAYLAVWRSIGAPAFGDVAAPFIGASTSERWLVALPALWRAATLLFWPTDLSADYSPQVIRVDDGVSLALVLGVGAAVAVLWSGWHFRRTWPALTWGAAVAVVTYLPTSNVLFASGVVLAERNLYLAAVLPAVLVAGLVMRVEQRRGRRAAATLVVLACALLAWRSYERLPAWRDNKAFLTTLLMEHPESYRAHASAAAVLAGIGDTAAARREYARADSLFPRDPHLVAARAFFLLSQGDTAAAAPLVVRARTMLADQRLALRGDFLLALSRGDRSGARAVADSAIRRYPWEAGWYGGFHR